ncbi:TIGR00645 family protein [Kaistia geumhonensis]|uniref:UPF0114 protein QO015_004116 n=1 Tax=Kaistia geumhonensis TaxID=410839 RepID=A0ABU0MCJ1_9HYPH|nr:TIGR00645 family protein [Kaistia geumhonensis]MCX5481438.1 TIGR00645 family protein [Kaistia geumhonensis]MDQ0518503.1 uncharacterized protein (TIGR00645 family) [Kaistia geumhonensis]
MRSLESFIERVILASRWVLVVFNLGLAAALVLYAFAFIYKFAKLVGSVTTLDDGDMILAMLGLIDAALVASLLVMVMISSYENYVSRLDNVDVQLSWLGKLDSGSLKIKVASSIVAISSIHLLQIFLNANQYDNMKIMWYTIMHMAFVVSALLLGVLDRITAKSDPAKGGKSGAYGQP